MFINKWLVVDSLENKKNKDWQAGFCLDLREEPADISNLFHYLQKQPENSFTILLSGEDAFLEKIGESFIEKIVSIFFQPCYYLFNYQPLLFITGNPPASLSSTRLLEKCKKQGLKILMLEEKNDYPGAITNQFAYRLQSPDINYNLIVKSWLSQYLENKNPTEIHFLISEKERNLSEILEKILITESTLHTAEEYKVARHFYQKQALIDEYKHTLELKIASENDSRLYLDMQKKQTSNNVNWYYNEYEILPKWYKRFGHIIKVIMGKRSFRSLFNDRVKKYKG